MSLTNDQITAKNFKKFAESFAETIDGVGIPDGGTTGQVLKKKSATDYDVEWDDEEGGGGVTDYEDLDNLPSINGTQLVGNKTSANLGLQDIMQFSTMPTASASNEGDIVQYVGTTTSTYTNGYFYECVEDSGSYSWVEKSVQESSGGVTDFDDLTNRPLESDTIDIEDLDLPMPAKPTEYPILFDETGTEYQVGLYKRASDGKVKPIWRKGVTGLNVTCVTGNNWTNDIVVFSNISIERLIDVTMFVGDGMVIKPGEIAVSQNTHINAEGFTAARTITDVIVYYTKTTDEWKEV